MGTVIGGIQEESSETLRYRLVIPNFSGLPCPRYQASLEFFSTTWRAFMATIGAVCKMQKNQLGLTLIDLNVYYDPVRIVKSQTSYIEIGDDPGFIEVCYSDSGAERESDGEILIDTQPEPSIDRRFECTIDIA